MTLNNWKESTIGDIAKYANARINTRDLTLVNYVSTENMLPEKAGKRGASSVPRGNAIQFRAGQTLISNIRPYFKKIWYASVDGGCSADVLVFDVIDEIDGKYFFYFLNQDEFFDYVMGGSKGTKMPRGDKQQILMYPFKYPTKKEQKNISGTLTCLDDKIELNNRINKSLEEMAQAIFKSWFVDFEPFHDGEFEDSELGMIPKGWRVGVLEEMIELYDSKRIPLSSRKREPMKKTYPYYGATSLMDYVEDYLFVGLYILLGEDGTVMDSKGFPILQYVWGKFWVNNHAHVLKGKNGFNEDSLYMVLRNTNIQGIVTGAVQLKINQANLKSVKVIIPSLEAVIRFNNLIEPLFAEKRRSFEETQKLTELRDSLLPKLMSGEIRVPTEEVV